ncbi:FHIPEP family type III secretion protein [Shewanella sp. NKUCC05_KAH]|jgi:type III secretion protein V|uniref:FHIPEP family type III secretion protein n=1 Tax=Shewanella TaxID=22 RepID=UPI0015674989|nr:MULTISPECIES: FHIPEP family type III secretion protein [unclassified Shewanella]MBI1674078.1 FHIPEP family type III secretion protein [Shewanella sp. DW31]MBW3516235.1 FHIPEP family type III secretion protein [Shewanella sp. NKUCC01_JLK]MBW3529126.1 FHIPEP family type III secretion protein [Shewanella sp. NKUCC05_KAH]NRD34287.1 FHIPEP family type III secretion protein [Shewanella sp. DC2-4]
MIKRLRRFPIKFNPSSVIIAFALPTIILFTLPGVVIDLFILISFISSVLLLVIMLENDQPLMVTFLPTVVLLLTTFRLLLSIATTRNIIANEDVGNVIETVGEFVMGGNLISGLLIFIIITIVQFLVVTKGGERVAEVGARFSLDALPGRQMTIDGDLKSGLITGEQAQKLRSDLSTENRLFGSLDGAMKFVKGDAIAGILISLVNLFGGIYVGVNQFDLSLSESVSRFSVLTIGDGLVSQIPSLLLSIACGVYLTRIKGDEESSSFMGQMAKQVSRFWKSLLVIGALILLLGLLSPSLFYVCMTLFILCTLSAFLLWRVQGKPKTVVNTGIAGSGLYESLTFVLREPQHCTLVETSLVQIEKALWGQALGAPIITVDEQLTVDIEVHISGIRIYSFSHDESAELIEVLGDEIFVSDAATQNIATIVQYFLRKCLVEKYNLQYTSNIIEGLASQSEVIKNEIDSALGLNRVHDVIKEMIRAREFYLDRVTFFEALIYWSRIDNESKNWLNRIRNQARYEITSRLMNSEGKIYVALLSSELTECIETFVMGESEDLDSLIELQSALRQEVLRMTSLYGSKPTLVVNDNEINSVKSFFQQVVSTISVCSHGDIADPSCVVSSEPLQVLI